jgi:hypothetical protein
MPNEILHLVGGIKQVVPEASLHLIGWNIWLRSLPRDKRICVVPKVPHCQLQGRYLDLFVFIHFVPPWSKSVVGAFECRPRGNAFRGAVPGGEGMTPETLKQELLTLIRIARLKDVDFEAVLSRAQAEDYREREEQEQARP